MTPFTNIQRKLAFDLVDNITIEYIRSTAIEFYPNERRTFRLIDKLMIVPYMPKDLFVLDCDLFEMLSYSYICDCGCNLRFYSFFNEFITKN